MSVELTERALWRQRVAEATRLDQLELLAGELAEAPPHVAGPMRFAIAQRRLQIKRPAVMPRDTAPLAADLPACDGRALHEYRLGNAAFERLAASMAALPRAQRISGDVGAARFVLWASEWCRRHYAGSGLTWGLLATALGIDEDQTLLRAQTDAGLRLWRRCVRGTHNRRFLGTLAREGGFPTAAVHDGAHGWAPAVLAAIVAPLLGDPAADEAQALALAQQERGRLPAIFGDDDFVQLCADLAWAIVGLRRDADAPARAQGLPLVAWLDLHRPDWRNALPLTTGTRAADRLIEQLLTVEPVRGAHVAAQRLLRRDGRIWREAARVGFDGLLDSGTTHRLDRAGGRLRVFAAGPLAQFVGDELGLLDPPGDGETAWTARATQAAGRVRDLPFSVPMMVAFRRGLREEDRAILPGGKPRRGQVLVAEPEGAADADDPGLLRVVGSGSGAYRADVVFASVPDGWGVVALDAGEAVAHAGAVENGRTLWRMTGGARITSPEGDVYRIRCGQTEDSRDRLDIYGVNALWAEVAGDVDLFVGPPQVRANGAGDLAMREIGTRIWRRLPSPLPVGHYEIGWRREEVLLDRRTIAVVPTGAHVQVAGIGSLATYTIGGFAPAALTPGHEAPVRAMADDTWRAQPRTTYPHRFAATLTWPQTSAPPLTLSIAFRAPPAITRWDGTAPATPMTLRDLKEVLAIDPGASGVVMGTLQLQGVDRVAMSWPFVDELPLANVAADIASVLLPSLDARVVLDVLGADGQRWDVRQFAVTLETEGCGLVARPAIVDPDVMLCGRALADPSREQVLGAYSLLSDANHRPVPIPSPQVGPWIFYLRRGGRVLSRPKLLHGMPGAVGASVLGQTMVIQSWDDLNLALDEMLRTAAGSGEAADAIVRELVALVESLDGLPPVTFRVLQQLPAHPGVLARMALAAGQNARDAVLALAEALPFAWFLIPQGCWDAARGATWESGARVLASLGEAAAAGHAAQMVRTAEQDLIHRLPLLGHVLQGQPASATIEEAAQAFMRSSSDSVPATAPQGYRARLHDRLPAYFRRFDPGVIDVLDAPCAAALAVCGAWTPNEAQVRHMKLVRRSFPTWFEAAFAATL